MLMPVTEMPPARSLAGTTRRGAVGSGVGDAEAAMVPFALLSGAQGTFAQDVEEPERGLPWEVSTRGGDTGDPIC